MKCSFVSLALLIPCLASADVVREDVCRTAAQTFVRDSRAFDDSSELSMSFATLSTTKASLSSPAFYAYNVSSGGFVIVAADDSVNPVIGYSDEGAFNLTDAPENYRAWLAMWERIISDCRTKGVTADKKTADAWASLVSGKKLVSSSRTPVLLETAQWDQGSPYNMECPKIGAEQTITGCTATSVCILMRYHKWPESGTGTLPSYTYSEDGSSMVIKSIDLGDKYDWDQMPLSYDATATEAQKAQVSKLMYHVGVMLKSHFGLKGTGASPSYIYPGLIQYMHYDKNAIMTQASYYSVSEWVDLLEDNIEKVGPVSYAGYSDEGGHAFILDGFDENDKLHINWGWSGSQNGYFEFPAFDEYVKDNYAVLGLKKDQGGTYGDDLVIYNEKKSKCGLKATAGGKEVTSFEKGSSFKVELNAVANYSQYADFKGYLGIAVADRSNSVKQVLSQEEITLKSGYYHVYNFDVTLTESVEIGDKLIPVFKSEQTKNWTRIPFDRDDVLIVGEIPMADTRSIEESTSVSYSADSAILTLTTKDGASVKLLSSAGKDMSSAMSGQDKTYQINVSLLPADTYSIVLEKGKESKTFRIKMGLKK